MLRPADSLCRHPLGVLVKFCKLRGEVVAHVGGCLGNSGGKHGQGFGQDGAAGAATSVRVEGEEHYGNRFAVEFSDLCGGFLGCGVDEVGHYHPFVIDWLLVSPERKASLSQA